MKEENKFNLNNFLVDVIRTNIAFGLNKGFQESLKQNSKDDEKQVSE